MGAAQLVSRNALKQRSLKNHHPTRASDQRDVRMGASQQRSRISEAARAKALRPSKNNAPATMLGASPSLILENFHRDAIWRGDRLFVRGRIVAKIVPYQQRPGMWRVQLPNGYLSDIVNRSRAKDAALTLAYTNA